MATANWDGVSEVLKSRPNAAITPHPGDRTALIPHTFIDVLRKFSNARIALSFHHTEENDGENMKNQSSLRLSQIKEVGTALQKLLIHFQKLLANEERLRDALRGHEEGNVIWIEPHAQQDFVDFVSALCVRSERSSCSRQELSDVVEWALASDFNQILDSTGVEPAADACRSLESAFQTFENAFNTMLKAQQDLDAPQNDIVA